MVPPAALAATDVVVSALLLLLAQAPNESPRAAMAATPLKVRRLSRRLVTRGPFDDPSAPT
jgi:hypothetical protein